MFLLFMSSIIILSSKLAMERIFKFNNKALFLPDFSKCICLFFQVCFVHSPCNAASCEPTVLAATSSKWAVTGPLLSDQLHASPVDSSVIYPQLR